ncbi:MAG TPA: hypothetical protein VKY85_09800, partial [Candidatus Angelobacter sp.]|nr:hypothetical protein [Candidatus Angelobacter sp.]
MRSPGFYIAVAMILLASISALAQSAPDAENGFKNYGSYHGTNLDTVNVTNGNWMLHAPVLPDAVQRGSLTDHLMMYSTSKNWQPSCTFPSTGPVCQWSIGPVPSLGANSFGGVLLERGFDLRLTRTVIKTNDGSGTLTWGINGYTLRTADMATHQLYPISVDGNSDPAAMETIDTSGYHVVMSNADLNGIENTVTLTDRQGRQYVGNFDAYSSCTVPNIAPIPSVGGRSPVQMAAPFGDQYCTQVAWLWQVTDANGNQMSFHGPQNSNAGVDTLGRGQPLESGTSTSDTAGCVSSLTINGVYLMAYNAPNGTQQQLKLCYATLPLATAFNQTAYGVQIKEAPNSVSAVQVLVTAILADGSKWVFNYDSYGEITSVELPAGGSISLTWTTVSQSGGCSGLAQVSRAVATRTLNDNNGHSYLWTYQWGTPANNSLTNVVTDPLGNDTVHGFTFLGNGCRFYETSTQNYQGRQSGGQLLQQVDTVYSSSVLNDNSGSDVGNVVPVSIKTTVYPSGKVKLVTKSYDAGLGANAPIFGNVVTEKEYDWGQGAAGALLRETDTTYQWQVNSAYLTAHLLDLPSAVIVKDGNGNRVAETDYTYDESAYLTPSNVTTQHGAAPNAVRGNLTTVSKWLNTSSSPVVSHSNWYDTGEVYQAIDPLGNTTTHSYDPAYVGGYSTRTCNALSQCVSGTYDFNTGLLTSFTDANGSYAANGNTPGDPAHTSNYSYDLMSRLTTVQLPADPAGNHPQTTLTYSPANSFPLNVQRTRSITASMNDVATNYFDGLGRVYEGQHSTPSGNATVQTTYDGLDHAVSVTNPYFSTSDPTYGVIQTQYDALGRVTQVTKQDGSASSVAYDTVPIQAVAGDCTKSTDEAGKQRLTCADGLGRLTEVHEPGDNFSGSQAQGSFSVGGNLQTYTIPGTNATTATGSVTISGHQQSIITSTRVCDQYGLNGRCVAWETDSTTTYDSGAVTITVNGQPYTYNYGANQQTDNVSSISSALQSTINNTSSYVQVSSVSVNLSANPPTATLYLQARSAGASGNFSLAASTSYNTQYFTQASFTAGASGASLTGGANGTNPSTVYDSGTVTVTIGSFDASAPYSQSGNSTAGQVAQALISSSNPNNLNRSGSPVTASVSGSTLTITYASIGAAGNVPISCGSSTSQGTYFSSPSFSCPATTALNGGYNPETASLDFNYFVTQYSYDALGNL